MSTRSLQRSLKHWALAARTDSARRVACALVVGTVALACGPDRYSEIGPDVRAELSRGRNAAAGWIAESRTAHGIDPEFAVALGYLERLRLGLGSPFRLIDLALADPRLTDSVRIDLGWALLARTIDRQAYRLDPAALDRAGPTTVPLAARVGDLHVRLIDDAITQSIDPRVGELAVRLAYTIAAADGSLAPAAPELAARAAALVRDRELARRDAQALLRAAQSEGRSPLALVHMWRTDRRFTVEQPPLAPIESARELYVLEVAPALATTLADLALGGLTARAASAGARASLLSVPTALALRAANEALQPPPQAPVAIAARMYRTELLWPHQLSASQREQRERFVESATTEESFAAELALIDRQGGREPAPALAALAAAVGLRSFAQEPVWFPGFGGPSRRELEERYGLAAVEFADDVPAAWRPYYRRMLVLALNDLLRVLPALSLDGLSVRFTSNDPEQAGALAIHDPRDRRLLLPPATSAGTIAHEVAHDLDWQVALRRYRVRGDYASDRASRSFGDHLGLRLADLAGGVTYGNVPADRVAAHRNRPAEIFARNVDWFVAVSLAATGVINGYLSSVQDGVLTGYGTVGPPDVTGAAGNALMTILDDFAPVYPATRSAFLKSFGPERAPTPQDLARTVLEATSENDDSAYPARAPRQWRSGMDAAFRDVERGRAEARTAIDNWICRSPGASYNARLQTARYRLVGEVAAARARGLAVEFGKQIAGESGAQWVRYELRGAPRRIEIDPSTVDALRDAVESARAVVRGASRSDQAEIGIALFSVPPTCSNALFTR